MRTPRPTRAPKARSSIRRQQYQLWNENRKNVARTNIQSTRETFCRSDQGLRWWRMSSEWPGAAVGCGVEPVAAATVAPTALAAPLDLVDEPFDGPSTCAS